MVSLRRQWGLLLTATNNATPRNWGSTQPEPRKHVCIILSMENVP